MFGRVNGCLVSYATDRKSRVASLFVLQKYIDTDTLSENELERERGRENAVGKKERMLWGKKERILWEKKERMLWEKRDIGERERTREREE